MCLLLGNLNWISHIIRMFTDEIKTSFWRYGMIRNFGGVLEEIHGFGSDKFAFVES